MRDVVPVRGPLTGYGRAARNAATSPIMPVPIPLEQLRHQRRPHDRPVRERPHLGRLRGRADPHPHHEREVGDRPEPLDQLAGGPGELVPGAR